MENKKKSIRNGKEWKWLRFHSEWAYVLNHSLDEPVPFARQPIKWMGPAHVPDKKSVGWGRGPFARQSIRIWAYQPNYPRHSQNFQILPLAFPLPGGSHTPHTRPKTQIDKLSIIINWIVLFRSWRLKRYRLPGPVLSLKQAFLWPVTGVCTIVKSWWSEGVRS